MSQSESRTVAYLVSSLIAAILYFAYAVQQYQEGSFNSLTISRSWGIAVLVVIGVQIVLSIISAILASIGLAIKEREEVPELSDERDQLIELRANRISFSVFGVGFLIAMITLAADLVPLVMFNLIVFSLFAGAISGYVSQLYRYRRGF
jgi:hypothetical protein